MVIFRGSVLFLRALFCISGAKSPGAPVYISPGEYICYRFVQIASDDKSYEMGPDKCLQAN